MRYLYDGMVGVHTVLCVVKQLVASVGPVADKSTFCKQLKLLLMLMVIKLERGFNIEVQCSICCVLSSYKLYMRGYFS